MPLVGSHDHPDGDTLTIGCSGCIARVEHDQWEAVWGIAPVRHCTWRFGVKDTTVSFTLDVRVPAGMDADDIDDRYMGATGAPLTEAIAARFPKLSTEEIVDLNMEACDRLVGVTIGPIITDSATVPQPDLFDGAA